MFYCPKCLKPIRYDAVTREFSCPCEYSLKLEENAFISGFFEVNQLIFDAQKLGREAGLLGDGGNPFHAGEMSYRFWEEAYKKGKEQLETQAYLFAAEKEKNEILKEANEILQLSKDSQKLAHQISDAYNFYEHLSTLTTLFLADISSRKYLFGRSYHKHINQFIEFYKELLFGRKKAVDNISEKKTDSKGPEKS